MQFLAVRMLCVVGAVWRWRWQSFMKTNICLDCPACPQVATDFQTMRQPQNTEPL
jgi:hypothetical protein